MPKRVLYTRADGKWTWRLEADNDGILAADGGSGYENEADARSVGIASSEGVPRRLQEDRPTSKTDQPALCREHRRWPAHRGGCPGNHCE